MVQDQVALRVIRAAVERPAPAFGAAFDDVATAIRFGAGDTGLLQDRFGFPAFREAGAGYEAAKPPRFDHHGFSASVSMLAFVAASAVADLIGLLVHADLGHRFICVAQSLLEWPVELTQHGHPVAFTPGNVVQFLFHLGREVKVHDVGEILGEQIGDCDSQLGGS